MEWTLETIREKVRTQTGKQSARQISDSSINDAINSYIQYTLPDEIKLEDQDTWYELDTVIGQGAYSIDVDILQIKDPITIDGIPINLYRDANKFFILFPRDNESSSAYNTPTDVLVYDNTIYLRPIPDAVYTLRVSAIDIPTALSDDSDTPEDNAWGPLIACGTSIELLASDGDIQAAGELSSLYETYKTLIIRRQLRKYDNLRADPRF